MASEIKVDTISEKTSAGGVTIDGLLIKDGGISGDVSLIGTTPTFTIGDAGAEDATLLFDGNAQDFHIGLDDTADDLVIGVGSTLGTTTAIAIDENTNTTFSGTVTVGVDDTGKDVKFFGATASRYWLWDESADGVVQRGTLTVGVDDTGHDVKLFGATAGSYALWDESANNLNLVASGLGVISAKDLGTGIHVKSSDTGASVEASVAEELVLERNSHCGMTILSSTSTAGTINFGDSGDNDIGSIVYDHSSNAMAFTGNTAVKLYLKDTGQVSTGAETQSDADAGGITVHHGANDDHSMTFKNSDVAHGITNNVETDTYFTIGKQTGASGGVQLNGYHEGANGMKLHGVYTTSTTGKASDSEAPVNIIASKKNGADITNAASNDNLVTIIQYDAVAFIFDKDGDFHADSSSTTFDAYDDAQLARAWDLTHNRGVVESKFDKFVAYNHEKLADLQLVGREKDGTPNHFINVTGFQRLHNGAIWQQYEKHNQLLEAVYDLAKKAVGKEEADAILEKHEVKRLQ